MASPLEQARAAQHAMKLQQAKMAQAIGRGDVADDGADHLTRFLGGLSSDPADRLQTVRSRIDPMAQIDPQDPTNVIFRNPETGQLTRYNPRGLDLGDVASLGREAAQAVGGAAGAAIGGATGLLGGPFGAVRGAIAGSGLGTAAGEELVRLVGQALGATDTRTLGEQLGETAAIGALGAAGEAGGAVLGQALRAGTKRVLRGGTSPEAVQQAIDDLAPSGVTPTVGQATKNSVIDYVESTLAKSPGSATVYRDVVERTSGKVGQQIERVASDVAGVKPGRLDPEFAGRTIQAGAEDFVKRFQVRAAKMYNEAATEIPPTRAVQASRTTQTLSELADEIIPSQRIPEMQQRLAGRLGEDGTLAFRDLQRLRTEVGRKLTDTSLVTDLPRGDLKRLYGALTDDLKSAARAEGPEALRKFERANRFYQAGLKRIDKQLEPIIKNKVPEKIFESLERGGRSGATRIRELRKSLTPDQWGVVAGTTVRRLGEQTPGQAIEGGEFSFNRFLTNWNSLDEVAKSAMFEGTSIKPDLEKVVRAAQRIRDTGGAFANPSGTTVGIGQTAGLLSVGSLVTGLASGGLSVASLPVIYGVSMLAANRAAKIMTNPSTVRWLAQATEIKPRGLTAHIGRLAGIAQGADFETKVAIQEYLTRLQEVLPPGEAELERRRGLGE